MTRGCVRLTDVEPAHLTAVVVATLRKSGVRLTVGRDTLEAAWTRPLKPVPIKTRVYPGFPTDMQAQWMALMAVTPGKSVIEEDIFENRFLHAEELLRMNARIETHGPRARVDGGARLSGCPRRLWI